MTDTTKYGPWKIAENYSEIPTGPRNQINLDGGAYAYREVIRPVRKTFTIKQFGSTMGESFSLTYRAYSPSYVEGTATVETLDGKIARVAWVADQ